MNKFDLRPIYDLYMIFLWWPHLAFTYTKDYTDRLKKERTKKKPQPLNPRIELKKTGPTSVLI